MVDAIRLRDDDVHEEPAVSLDSFLDQSNATAVRIEAGNVLRDQYLFMRRCGFDAFAPDSPINRDHMEEALNRYEHVYQATSDQRTAIWRLRHG